MGPLKTPGVRERARLVSSLALSDQRPAPAFHYYGISEISDKLLVFLHLLVLFVDVPLRVFTLAFAGFRVGFPSIATALRVGP